MRKLAGYMIVLLALATLVAMATSCGSAATAVPAAVPSAPPAATPTSAEVAVATPKPTLVPTKSPTVPPSKSKGTPSPKDAVPHISVEELKAMMDSGAALTILDARPKESYVLGHIKGAISFPWKAGLTFDDVDELPCCGASIVAYCDCGPGEFDSADVARQLIELDYDGDVMVLADPSIEGWIAAGYPAE